MNLSRQSQNEPDMQAKQPGTTLNCQRKIIPVFWNVSFKLQVVSIRHSEVDQFPPSGMLQTGEKSDTKLPATVFAGLANNLTVSRPHSVELTTGSRLVNAITFQKSRKACGRKSICQISINSAVKPFHP
jgi:hypothetical protein